MAMTPLTPLSNSSESDTLCKAAGRLAAIRRAGTLFRRQQAGIGCDRIRNGLYTGSSVWLVQPPQRRLLDVEHLPTLSFETAQRAPSGDVLDS